MDRPGIDVFSLAAGVHRRLAGAPDVRAAVGGSEAQARAQICLALDLSGDRATQAAARIWVLPAAEQAGGAGGDVEEDGPGQPLTLRVTVLHIAATYNTRGAGDAAPRIDRLRDRTRAALAGWVPPCVEGTGTGGVTHVVVAPDDLDRIPDPDRTGALLANPRPVAPFVAPLRSAGGRLTAIGELIQGGRAWWADDYTIPVWLPF